MRFSSRRRDRNRNSPIAVGLLVCGGVLALWENEGRFDYATAAREAREVRSLDQAQADEAVSLTGKLEEPTIAVRYVEPVRGYLSLEAVTEIYSYVEDRDSDGDRYIEREWSGQLEGLRENRELKKLLSSELQRPDTYVLGGEQISSARVHFVDDEETLDPGALKLTSVGLDLELAPAGDYFFRGEGSASDPELGDERVSFRGVRATRHATWFGAVADGRGAVKDYEIAQSWISSLIGNDGLLHHLVNGRHEEAVDKIAADLSAARWKVRLGGTLAIMLGIYSALSMVASLLYVIPVVGQIAQGAAFVVSAVLGLIVSLSVILASMLWHHPLALVLPAAVMTAIVLYFRSLKAKAKANARSRARSRARDDDAEQGGSAGDERLFDQMIKMATADGELSDKESRFLRRWATQAGIPQERMFEMLRAATEADAVVTPPDRAALEQMIALALADGAISAREMRMIQRMGETLGMSRAAVRALTAEVSSAA
jgi:uncharacterized tellurite resistance protein B-like protein